MSSSSLISDVFPGYTKGAIVGVYRVSLPGGAARNVGAAAVANTNPCLATTVVSGASLPLPASTGVGAALTSVGIPRANVIWVSNTSVAGSPAVPAGFGAPQAVGGAGEPNDNALFSATGVAGDYTFMLVA